MSFVPDVQIERETLRQGDLVADIHLVGSICFKDVFTPNNILSEGAPKQWGVNGELKTGPVMVLSHCCEIARENGIKLTSIVLAPLRDLSKATAPSKIQELIDSNEVREDGSGYTYLKYFYLPNHHQLPFTQGFVVDFSKIFSVRKSSYDVLLDKKFAQVDEATREKIALKLGLYFYRQQEAA